MIDPQNVAEPLQIVPFYASTWSQFQLSDKIIDLQASKQREEFIFWQVYAFWTPQ